MPKTLTHIVAFLLVSSLLTNSAPAISFNQIVGRGYEKENSTRNDTWAWAQEALSEPLLSQERLDRIVDHRDRTFAHLRNSFAESEKEPSGHDRPIALPLYDRVSATRKYGLLTPGYEYSAAAFYQLDLPIDYLGQWGLGQPKTIEVLEDIVDPELDRFTLALGPEQKELSVVHLRVLVLRVIPVLRSERSKIVMFLLNADHPLSDGSGWANFRDTPDNGFYQVKSTQVQSQHSEALMQRTLTLLILRGNRKPLYSAYVRMRRANAMYERMRKDPRLRVTRPFPWLRYKVEPAVGDDAAAKSFAFPWLKLSASLRLSDLLRILNSKYTSHRLFDGPGSPIKHAGWYAALRPDLSIIDRLQKRTPDILVENTSIQESSANSQEMIDFDQVIKKLSGPDAHTLVFKPNSGELGRNMAFFEPLHNGKIRITIAWIRGQKENMTDVGRLNEFLGEHNLPLFREQRGQHVGQVTLPLRADILKGLWEILTQYPSASSPRYDSGTIEDVVPFKKWNGLAFETRHRFIGNLKSGQIEHIRGDTRDGSFARIGSSSYFSNYTGREDGAKIRFWMQMMKDLSDLFEIEPERRAAFFHYVDETVENEFVYLVSLLKASGIHLDSLVKGQFDLVWLPVKNKGDFPIPVYMESRFEEADGRLKSGA